jgi:hypothetical protein
MAPGIDRLVDFTKLQFCNLVSGNQHQIELQFCNLSPVKPRVYNFENPAMALVEFNVVP